MRVNSTKDRDNHAERKAVIDLATLAVYRFSLAASKAFNKDTPRGLEERARIEPRIRELESRLRAAGVAVR